MLWAHPSGNKRKCPILIHIFHLVHRQPLLLQSLLTSSTLSLFVAVSVCIQSLFLPRYLTLISIPNRLSYISRLSSSNSMFGGFGREKLNYDDQSNCTLLTHHVSVRHIEVGLQSSYCGQHKIKDK